MESNIESNIENNLESLLKAQMGYAYFSKACKNCTYHENGKCFLNKACTIEVESHACCDFWKEQSPIEIDKIIGYKMKSEEGEGRIGPDITPEADMLKS